MKITIYTIPDCPFCKQEKDYLTSKGLQYEEKDVQANKEFLAELLEKSNKFAGVPFSLFEEGGKVIPIKGFTQAEFDKVLQDLQGGQKPEAMSVQKPPQDVSASSTAVQSPSATVSPVEPIPSSPTLTPMPAGDTGKSNLPLNPVMPSQPKVDMPPMPAPMGTFPNTQSAPPADPQAELDNLLKDLQVKTNEPAPMGSGVTLPGDQKQADGSVAFGATTSPLKPEASPPPVPPMPQMPPTEPVPGTPVQTPQPPAMPDFGKIQ